MFLTLQLNSVFAKLMISLMWPCCWSNQRPRNTISLYVKSLMQNWCLNVFHTEAEPRGNGLPNRTHTTSCSLKRHNSSQIRTGNTPALCVRSKPPPLTDALAKRLLKMCPSFQPWADCLVLAISANQPPYPYIVTCPQTDAPTGEGYTSLPSLSRELSSLCPIHGGIPKGGDSPLSVSLHSRHTTAFNSVSPKSSLSGCGGCFTFCRVNLGQLRDQTPP